ncbi:MAG: RluA family pseudouridine synthase [Clostridia bacterium]|nr:RluA family pseudouridine synthase [Clostridia bacterium]
MTDNTNKECPAKKSGTFSREAAGGGAAPLKLRVVYDNAGCIVCIKPAGIPTEGEKNSATAILSEQTGHTVLPVHRLDTDTSGVMVFAYKKDEAARLSELIREKRSFEKVYLTVVEGCPEEPSGIFSDLLYFDRARNKSFVVSKSRAGVKEASLCYETVASAETEGHVLSLVRVRLNTGRTHQIRVQFASRGMPVAGDRRYGSHLKCALALRSEKISFPDRKGNMLSFENPSPFVYPFDIFSV